MPWRWSTRASSPMLPTARGRLSFPSGSSSPLGDRSTATVADGSPPPRANDDDEPKGPGVQVSTRTPSFFCSLLDLYLRSEMVMLSHFYSKVWPICVWKRIWGHAGSRTGHPTEGCYFLAPHLLSAVTAVMFRLCSICAVLERWRRRDLMLVEVGCAMIFPFSLFFCACAVRRFDSDLLLSAVAAMTCPLVGSGAP